MEAQPATSAGIASVTDAFEAANPMLSNVKSLVGEQSEIVAVNKPLVQRDQTMDASTLFGNLVDVPKPAPPSSTRAAI